MNTIAICVTATICIYCGLLIGNFVGDAATLKDCAVTGQAVMMSGGTIQCSVVRSAK